jgi:hypothetical protein
LRLARVILFFTCVRQNSSETFKTCRADFHYRTGHQQHHRIR